MNVTIHDQEYPLVKSNVALSRKYISRLINTVKEAGAKSHDEAFYPTFLIMMSYMSSVLLDEIPASELQAILSAEAEADKQRKKLKKNEENGEKEEEGKANDKPNESSAPASKAVTVKETNDDIAEDLDL